MKKTSLKFLVYAGISLVFLLIYARTTSPVYHIYGADSDVFMLMGKLMHQGEIPYVDFFDHKGPVLMFLMYISYGFVQNKCAVLVLEAVFLVFTIWGIQKTIGLFDFEKKTKYVQFFGTLIAMAMFFDRGNTVGEYCLPFLVWSQYFTIQFFQEKDLKKVFRYAVFFGITFAVCAYTRLTNAFPLCAEMLTITLFFAHDKKWKELGKAIGGFISGCAIVSIPIFIYFYAVDAIPQMLYCTFTYNFRYAVLNQMTYHYTALDVLQYVSLFMTAILLSFVVGLISVKKYSSLASMLIYQSVFAIFFQFGSALYEHYLLVYAPTILLAFLLLDMKKIVQKVIYCVMILSLVAGFGWSLWKSGDAFIHNDVSITNEFKKMASVIDEKDRDKVIAYNGGCFFYLATGIDPCYKYIHLQDFQCAKDFALYDELQNLLQSRKAKYIIHVTTKEFLPEIKEIVDENYEVYMQTETHTMLKRID